MQTKHKFASLGLALALSLTAAPAFAQVMVGGAPMLAIADVVQSNGVIHVVDKVLLPM